MNTCATCKHWHAEDSDVADALIRLGEPHDGSCSAVTDGMRDKRAYIEWQSPTPREWFHVWLKTRSDFGCVLWEAKE